MLITELVLNNFRIYRGENRFDLAPRKRYGKVRPIVLFGGLNGSGKTSILSGLRLALYGKSSLGPFTSQNDYSEFLKKSIHRSKRSHNDEASVELAFDYSKLGINSSYRVVRKWKSKGRSVKETLEVSENGVAIKGLNYDQAQSFLNELIPIGVSDLFFFDGEKIKELADDTGGLALESSIKKLLGLDVIERLSGDLTVLNRNLTKNSSFGQIQKEIDLQQDALNAHRDAIERFRSNISLLLIKHAEMSQDLSFIQAQFDERGGHYSISRKNIEQEISWETSKKAELVGDITHLLSDATPLVLSKKFKDRVEAAIQFDLNNANPFSNSDVAKRISSGLNQRLSRELGEAEISKVNSALSALIDSFTAEGPDTRHDLTPTQASAIMATFRKAEEQSNNADELFQRLEECEARLDELGAILSRAPDDDLVREDFHKLLTTQRGITKLEAEIEAAREQAKKEANQALECARKLDRLYEKASHSSDQSRVLNYISATNELLDEFVHRSSQAKISELESQFIQCFSRLARKDDFSLQIKVDPSTFNFDLLTAEGEFVDKDDLSAGEKQIFAISILEALAKTSGRQLPMIVDTPLGRLDSMHRRKLIEEYFPKASHQMIILSTDTEVDKEFYESLSPDISRAFQLEYNADHGATQVNEGYFWQQRHTG